jgi:hypothetical protein
MKMPFFLGEKKINENDTMAAMLVIYQVSFQVLYVNYSIPKQLRVSTISTCFADVETKQRQGHCPSLKHKVLSPGLWVPLSKS